MGTLFNFRGSELSGGVAAIWRSKGCDATRPLKVQVPIYAVITSHGFMIAVRSHETKAIESLSTTVSTVNFQRNEV